MEERGEVAGERRGEKKGGGERAVRTTRDMNLLKWHTWRSLVYMLPADHPKTFQPKIHIYIYI